MVTLLLVILIKIAPVLASPEVRAKVVMMGGLMDIAGRRVDLRAKDPRGGLRPERQNHIRLGQAKAIVQELEIVIAKDMELPMDRALDSPTVTEIVMGKALRLCRTKVSGHHLEERLVPHMGNRPGHLTDKTRDSHILLQSVKIRAIVFRRLCRSLLVRVRVSVKVKVRAIA